MKLLMALMLVVGAPLLVCADVASLGPYTVSFNHRMKERAERAGLIGQPQERVEAVMGAASFVYDYPAPMIVGPAGARVVGKAGRTFDYYPYPFLPVSKFQVHCHEGVVTGLEMFDD